MSWKIKVGLEIHARINVKSKLFSGASSKFLHKVSNPNQQVALFDAGIPGTLPRLNEQCVNQAIVTGLALRGTVNEKSLFERKHYFYGDSPLGYQITQQRFPIMSKGLITFRYLESDTAKATTACQCRITRIQLEQDTGRLTVEDASESTSFLDLNRAGTGLMEIVTEPDLNTPEEAAGCVLAIQSLLRHFQTCDGNMEDGSLRVDVNVSVHSENVDSHRVEVKNINSIRNIVKAVQFEAHRLEGLYSAPGHVKQGAETRSFNASNGETVAMRSKEGATDYRFFPEPDLPPLVISSERIRGIEQALPKLPEEIIHDLISVHDLPEFDARQLFQIDGGVQFFEEMIQINESRDKTAGFSKIAAQWICNSITELMNQRNVSIHECGITSAELASIILLIQGEKVSHANGKTLFTEYVNGQGRNRIPEQLAEELGLLQCSDIDTIQEICQTSLDKQLSTKKGKKNYELYVSGSKPALIGFFVGQALAESGGRANPKMVKECMERMLKEATA